MDYAVGRGLAPAAHRQRGIFAVGRGLAPAAHR